MAKEKLHKTKLKLAELWYRQLLADLKIIELETKTSVILYHWKRGDRIVKDEEYLKRKFGDNYFENLALDLKTSSRSLRRDVQFRKHPKFDTTEKLQEFLSEQTKINWWRIYEEYLPEYPRPPKDYRMPFTLWSFPIESDEKYYGKLPENILRNLLWFFTKKEDLVLDPMAGTGSIIDICKEQNRRCKAYDIKPMRKEIIKNDITAGIPEKDESIDFIFLDPPYWKRAKDRYTKEPTDLSQMDKEEFYATLKKTAKECKRVLKKGGKVALIVGNVCFKDDFEDLGFNSYQIFSDYFKPLKRIVTNDPTSFTMQKEEFIANKWFVGNFRDLLIFEK